NDDVVEYPPPFDVVEYVRGYQPPDGDRRSLSISGCPNYLSWTVESLSNRSGASVAKTHTALFDVGMRLLWTFPGTRDLQDAREVIIAAGDPDPIRWMNSWEFDVGTHDTGKTTPKVRVPVFGVLTPLGKLATVFGFTKSTTAILALAVATLEDTAVPDAYHGAQAEMLRRFEAKLRERADKAAE